MLAAILFCLLCARGAQPVFLEAATSYGTYTTRVLSASTTEGGKMTHVLTTSASGVTTNWVVELISAPQLAPPILPQVNFVVGRIVSSVEIIVQPRGCDNVDPTQAVEDSNCAQNTVDANNNKIRLQANWFWPYESDGCILGGGDRKSCLGPPIAVLQDPTGITNPTDSDLLFSSYVMVFGAGGLYGALPTVVPVDMVLPQLLVTSNCIAPPIDPVRTFSGEYQGWKYDEINAQLEDVTYVFERDDGVLAQMRVIFRRTAFDSDDFQIVLADSLGGALSDGFYRYYFTSQVYYGNGTSLWRTLVPFNQNLTMVSINNATANQSTCYLVLGIQPTPNPPRLNDIVPVTSVNYLAQPSYDFFYASAICGFQVGELDENNNLVYPGVPDGTLSGGYGIYCVLNVTYCVPIEIQPDIRYLDYVDNTCNAAYPRSPQFFGFGLGGGDGPLYNRFVPAQERCYAPFFSIQSIENNNFVQERQRQCSLMGMQTAGPTQDACQRRLQDQPCRKGWIYFGDYCFYRFNPTTDTKYIVVDSQAQFACNTIPWAAATPTSAATTAADFNVEVLTSATLDQRAWLQEYFVLWNPQGSNRLPPGVPFRIPIPGASNCYCLDYLPGISGQDTDVGQTALCNCRSPAFPLCRYAIKRYEVVDRYISQSMQTIRPLRDGQAGIKWSGKPMQCQCFPGSTGKACQIPTCPIQFTFGNSLPAVVNSTLTNFFLKCYNANQGECKDGQPRACFCDPYHGPAASLIANSPFFPYAQFPCICPASTARSGTFQINNGTYTGLALNLPCGGIKRGVCTGDAFTNSGYCSCVSAWLPAYNSTGRIYGGDACTCRIPVVPAFGYILDPPNIQATACNARGTCCPSPACQFDGCMCGNGWGGTSCTCPVPLDIANGLVVVPGLGPSAVLDFTLPVFITSLLITPKIPGIFLGTTGCTVLSAGMAQSSQGASLVACSPSTSNGITKWFCPLLSARYLILATIENQPRCAVQAFVDETPPCGYPNATNSFSARFYANEVWDSPGTFKMQQDPKLGRTGCTDSACLCDPNHTGKLCRAGVSALSQNTYGDFVGQFIPRVCGETTQPKRGVANQVSSSSEGTGGCSCLSITTAGLVGFGGLPQGVFFGQACSGSSWYVQERNEYRECAGHGVNMPIQMPWGSCSFDLASWETDPLFYPLVPGGCNDPIVRTIDKGNWLNGSSLVCTGPIGPYSNVLGVFYGLFWDQVWTAPFIVNPLGTTQLQLVSSILNNERWFQINTSIPVNMFNLTTIDAYNIYLSATQTSTSLRSSVFGSLAWPFNLPLRQAYLGLGNTVYSAPINLANADDLGYVLDMYYGVLAPRRCTGDNECQTFSRTDNTATCEYDSTDFVGWRQGDPLVQETFSIGDEGGCQPYTDWGLGFYDYQVITRCESGYGPVSQAQFIEVLAYQNLLFSVVGPGYPLLFDPASTPFAAILAATGTAQLDLINQTLACRIPWSESTNGHFCNSAGTVSIATSSSTQQITEFRVPAYYARITTPMCTSLLVDGVNMAGIFLAEQLYAYTNGTLGVNIVQGTPYFWSAGGVATPGVQISCANTSPMDCLYAVGAATKHVTCANPAFYGSPSNVDSIDGGFLLGKRPWGVWSLILTPRVLL